MINLGRNSLITNFNQTVFYFVFLFYFIILWVFGLKNHWAKRIFSKEMWGPPVILTNIRVYVYNLLKLYPLMLAEKPLFESGVSVHAHG